MKVCFCTNIWNHHQAPVCRELARMLGDDFRMFVYQPLDCDWSRERIEMGWNLIPPNESWIVGPPKTTAELAGGFFQGWIEAADVLVYGENKYFDTVALKRRLQSGKLSFKMGERLLKIPIRWYHWLSLRFIKRWVRVHQALNDESLHYLAMSHWCADDLRFYRACRGRVWRWGYLTSVSEHPVEKPLRTHVRVGWCGRFLYLKNVRDILQAVFLLEDSIKNQMEIVLVGDGPEKEDLISMTRKLGLDDRVKFLPFMSAEDAKAFMRDLDIYVFPSGRQEGWGAALAEAMDASCAVVANEAAGSTLELVKDGENGFVFGDGDVAGLSVRLRDLVQDAVLRRQLGQRAWQTVQAWSPREGAIRLLKLARHLISGNPPPAMEPGLCERVG